MIQKARLKSREALVLGFVLGACATVVGFGVYHELRGLHRLNLWQRSFEERRLERSKELMEGHVALAMSALADRQPLTTSEQLAFEFMGTLYRHHLSYAKTLLESGAIDRFNQLRASTGYVLFDFSGDDLEGLDLGGADLSGCVLERAKLAGCDLTDTVLAGADLHAADLSGAIMVRTVLAEANLAGAMLTGITGRGSSFANAVLEGASLTKIADLEESDFSRAILANANLWASRFPGARFDHADMSMSSAVDADFSSVAAMNDVDLTGANLSGARIEPSVTNRAWLVRGEGLDGEVVRALRDRGGVTRPEQVLELVEEVIVDGFRAQIASNEAIRPEQRQAVLLDMLQRYYQQ